MSTRRRRKGFTLLEVMLVLVIIVVMASAATFFLRGAQRNALKNAARAQIGTFKNCIEAYQLHVRNYPSTSQGLIALIQPPGDLANPDRWQGPYLDAKEIPLDPWDNQYQYQQIDSDNYVIWSVGEDGVDGSEDDIRSDQAS